MNSWYTIRAQTTGAEVLIYDEIGAYGISAKGFLAELGTIRDGTPLALRLNSPGGSVFDAVAIYNAIKRHSGIVTVWIDGIAASAASYIRAEAMAYSRAVVDLCRLAGQPQMAADFLAAEATLDAVRKALIEARAATEPAISSAHPQPGPGSNARPWGDVIARTFKRKG